MNFETELTVPGDYAVMCGMKNRYFGEFFFHQFKKIVVNSQQAPNNTAAKNCVSTEEKNIKRIRFSAFEITKGHIACKYQIGNSDEGDLYFNLLPEIIPTNDSIAIALSTLCYIGYTEIQIDLPISLRIKESIERYTRAKLIVDLAEESTPANKCGNKTVLNFSGGFDSLAAKALMPEDTALVAMDFGGRFSREREFFKKFNPCIVSTNLTETPLKNNHWSFMGIASILFSDYIGASYCTFGNILEASINNFTDIPAGAKNVTFPMFSTCGMQSAPYVLGLTEVGTLNVVAHYYPELFSASLTSLAGAGDEKWYRKRMLASIAKKRFGFDFEMEEFSRPAKCHFKFGKSFAADFLALYIIKYGGMELASYTISDIPEEAEVLAKKLNLDFYDRINPNFLVDFPKPLLGGLLDKLAGAGIIPYTRKDWDEFEQVREFLAKYYTIK